MKKYVIVIACFCFTASAFAQKTYLDKVADSTCKCLEAGKDKVKSPADFDKLGENCFMVTALPYLDSFAKDENVPVEEIGDALKTKIGEKLGMKMAASCPVFLELLQNFSEDEEGDITRGTTTGVVATVQLSDHVYVSIKESSGKITKLLWLEYFDGADDYKKNPALLKGKRVEINWKEIEIYQIAKKEFAPVKMIMEVVVK